MQFETIGLKNKDFFSGNNFFNPKPNNIKGLKMNNFKTQNNTKETQKMKPRKSCKSLIVNGFTLIELLVVIAIIAILAAMLLPALQ